MSRAGKFIPGGAGKPGEGSSRPRTGPIRAPAADAPVPDATPGKKTVVKGSSLIKPVAKNQKAPILIMSAVVCCLLVSAGWYILAVLPAKRATIEMQNQLNAAIAAQKKAQDDLAKQQADAAAKAATLRATLTVDTKPTGATVTIGDFHKLTPASFNDLTPGSVSVVIHEDGYEDFKEDVTVTADKPLDLGTIALVQRAGNLSLTSPQSDVTYTLTGPRDYYHDGQIPDKLDKIPTGDYQLTVSQHDWKLAPIPLTIHNLENVQKEIKFPYASLTLTSTPPGATVRDGHTILGRTPLTLPQLHPGEVKYSVDLAPYVVQRISIQLPDFGNITRQVTLQQDKSFIAASGIPMVWIPDGEFWAGKYEVRQGEFETVAAYNPSNFRRPNRPVEQISWENAMAFCDKLTQYEKKAGRLPEGYHYTLPTESQWSILSADADIDQAPMSRTSTLSSTVDAGSSEPNKYGIYDTLGNVWEWCLDTYDDKGNHSLRGGSWLSSSENFPNAETRNGGGPKYSDKFTGFRVVLVPQ